MASDSYTVVRHSDASAFVYRESELLGREPEFHLLIGVWVAEVADVDFVA